jgi:tRNA pseudouridine38-40 synthase
MYAHFDYESKIDSKQLVHKLNSYLPKDTIYDVFLFTRKHMLVLMLVETDEYNTLRILYKSSVGIFIKISRYDFLMNEASLFNHTNFRVFSKVNTDVNTLIT